MPSRRYRVITGSTVIVVMLVLVVLAIRLNYWRVDRYILCTRRSPYQGSIMTSIRLAALALGVPGAP